MTQECCFSGVADPTPVPETSIVPPRPRIMDDNPIKIQVDNPPDLPPHAAYSGSAPPDLPPKSSDDPTIPVPGSTLRHALHKINTSQDLKPFLPRLRVSLKSMESQLLREPRPGKIFSSITD